jgi:hypothetical protein
MRVIRREKGVVFAGVWAYVWGVNWQELLALGIVAVTAGLFVRSWVAGRRGGKLTAKGGCGCSGSGGLQGGNSVVYRARRGEKPEVVVKMK